MNINDILPRLKGVKKTGSNWVAFCPAHDDLNNRSLTLTEKDGVLLMHCFCGCSFGSILKSLNLPTEYTAPQLEAVYDYTDRNGDVLYQVLRYYPKSFKQRQIVNGEYIYNLNGVDRVLFNLPDVLDAVLTGQVIYFVEGEKDCLNLMQYHLVATTLSGGALSPWLPQYSEVLHDAKVAIIPDGDEAGRKYAKKIGNQLYGWAEVVKWLNIGSKDITEWLKTHNVDELQSLWDNTKEYMPEGAITRNEFEALKGHLIYIHNLISKKKPPRGMIQIED